jgi:hypothetical protein
LTDEDRQAAMAHIEEGSLQAERGEGLAAQHDGD